MTSAGLKMIAARPLFGFGWSTYPKASATYFREAADYPMNGISQPASCRPQGCTPEILEPLHDTYLALAVELGLVGALLWLSAFLWGIGMGVFSRGPLALRPWKLGLLAMAICYLAICPFDPYQAPFPDLLLWLWAGVALGSEPAVLREPRRRSVTPVAPTSPTASLSPA